MSDPATNARGYAMIGVQPVANKSRTLSSMDFVHHIEGGDDATLDRSSPLVGGV
jgi:hypothetical protein